MLRYLSLWKLVASIVLRVHCALCKRHGDLLCRLVSWIYVRGKWRETGKCAAKRLRSIQSKSASSTNWSVHTAHTMARTAHTAPVCTANAFWQISKFINLHLFSAWKDEWTDWRRVAILRHFSLLLFLSAQRKEHFQFHGKTTIQRSPDYNLCQLFRSFLFIFLIAPRSCSCFCAPSIFLLLIFLLPFYSWIVMLLAQAHSTYNIITVKHHQNVCGKNCLTFSFPIIQ